MAMEARRALVDSGTMQRMLAAIGFTVVLYLVHDMLHLPPGLVALIGASVGLLWVRPKVEEVLADIHWDVLLFFMGLSSWWEGWRRPGSWVGCPPTWDFWPKRGSSWPRW